MVNLSSFYHCYKETFQFDSTLSQALLYIARVLATLPLWPNPVSLPNYFLLPILCDWLWQHTGCFWSFLAGWYPSNAWQVFVERKEAVVRTAVGSYFYQIASTHHPTPTVGHCNKIKQHTLFGVIFRESIGSSRWHLNVKSIWRPLGCLHEYSLTLEKGREFPLWYLHEYLWLYVFNLYNCCVIALSNQ